MQGKMGDIFFNLSGFYDFEYCSLCWRLVPKKKKGDRRKYYCGIHTYDPASPVPQTEYHLALKFNHNKTNSGDSPEPLPPTPGISSQILNQLHEHFPINGGGLDTFDWTSELLKKASHIDLEFFPNVEYDLTQLWRVCPNVQRYVIEQRGNDKSPESILEILDPETPNETEEFKFERKCLHKYFAKNFALYRTELALAESYLSEYYNYIDTHPQGGKRPGTGGKRPGAGRKPKKA